MYNVYCMTPNKEKKIILYNGQPAFFDTELDAWDFIANMMSYPQHPVLMWIKEVKNERS